MVLAILLRIHAVSVFWYITASIATCLIGSPPASDAPQNASASLRDETAGLREEIVALRPSMDRTDS